MAKFLRGLVAFLLGMAVHLACLLAAFTAAEFLIEYLRVKKGEKE